MQELKASAEQDRRTFLLGAAALSTAVAFAGGSALAQAKPETWEEMVKRLVGDAKQSEAKITLEMPEIAENGNTVPFSVMVDSPMTEQDYVKTVYVISTGNPQADVATYHFTPASGKASISSRMRLAKTQDVISIAQLSDGKVLQSKKTVKVTIGGCGG
jgi:sulfur-oxidizing protein SoxY